MNAADRRALPRDEGDGNLQEPATVHEQGIVSEFIGGLSTGCIAQRHDIDRNEVEEVLRKPLRDF